MPVCTVNYYRNKNDSDSEYITKEQSDRDDRYFYSPEDLDFFNDGYLFREWNTKRNGTGASYTPEDVVGDDYTLYAIWEALPRYRISSDTLTSLANTIRSEAGISGTLSYPDGFISAINSIQTGDLMYSIFNKTISSINDLNGSVSIIRGYKFYECSRLTYADFPNCIEIEEYAFYCCRGLVSINLPAVSSVIGAYAFYSCTNLENISCSCAPAIGTAAFSSCYKLKTADFSTCTSIASSGFANCSSLSTINFPVCQTIELYAFYNCYKLDSANFPSCTTISQAAFYNCSKLTDISFPNCVSFGVSTFFKCYNLKSAYFSLISSIPMEGFAYCSSLSDISFPNCRIIMSSAFAYCSKLDNASFPMCSIIYQNAFRNCSNLYSIYFLSTSYVTLSNYNAFSYTPISTSSNGIYGSIYVPSSMLNSYKTRTNWTRYSSRFVGMEV